MDRLPNSLTPLCFNRHEFTKPSFNVEQFLGQTRRHVSLDNIKEDLHIYLKILQNAMIELINKDYADFVNLSSNLVNLRSTIEKLQSDLGDLNADFGQYSQKLAEQVQLFKGKLSNKREHSAQENELQRQLLLYSNLEKVKCLLQTHQPIEINLAERLSFLVVCIRSACAKPDSVDEATSTAVADVLSSFQRCLDQLFRACVPMSSATDICLVLKAYRSCNRMESAQAVFMCEFLDPVIQKVQSTNDNSLIGTGSVFKSIVHEFRQLLDVLLQLYEKYKPVFSPSTTETMSGGSQMSASLDWLFSQRFLISCILTDLLTRFDKRFSGIVVSSDPDQFHQCFCAFADFAAEMANKAADNNVYLIKKNSLMSACFAKFSLPVYFQLRLQELTNKIYADMKHQSKIFNIERIPNVSPVPIRLKISSQLLESISRIFASEIFLPPVCDRFWELHMQLLNRYVLWVHEIRANGLELPKIPSRPSTPSLLQGGVQGVSPSASANDLSSLASKKSTVGVPTGLEGDGLENVSLLVVDCLVIGEKIKESFTRSGVAAIQSCGVKDLSVFHQCIDEWIISLQTAIRELCDMVAKHLATKIETVLAGGAKEVPRHYRWTRKDNPTLAMPYIAAAMKQMEAFLRSSTSLPPNIMSQIMDQCLIVVVPSFGVQIHTVVTSGEKATSSLRSLKRPKVPGGPEQPDQAAMDSEKIRQQLSLDVKELQKLALNEFQTLGTRPSAELIQKFESLQQSF